MNGGAACGSGGRGKKLADAYDSRVYPRHTAGAAAVASFRTWRSSRRAVARGPAIISICKQSASLKKTAVVTNSTAKKAERSRYHNEMVLIKHKSDVTRKNQYQKSEVKHPPRQQCAGRQVFFDANLQIRQTH